MVSQENQDQTIGVVLCDCAGTLCDFLDFETIVNKISESPGIAVAVVKRCSAFCKPSDCAKALKTISKQSQRLVIAACCEEIFSSALDSAVKKNKTGDLFYRPVNIRGQCALVHKDKTAATNKAIDLINAGVRRLCVSEPVQTTIIDISRDVVVLGSGVAGMQASVALAKLGHRVTLICKENKLGGHAGQTPGAYGYVADNLNQARSLITDTVSELVNKIDQSGLITVYLSSLLQNVRGQLGNFRVLVGSNGDIKFTQESMKRIFAYSNGIPRLINLACDRSLLKGYTAGIKTLDDEIVKISISEIAK